MIYNWSQWKSINENISQEQLNLVEEYADKLFGELGLDVEFSKHFRERMNDPRNGKPISIAELIGLFRRAHQKSGKKIADMPPNAEAVLKDMATDINTPFVIEYDRKNGDLDLVLKTIMRKRDFMSPDEIIKF
jgi:hypothetical protein